MSSIYSYVLTHDTGFAPNPYGGPLTLATCKPGIRRCASPGDWLFGTGSVRGVGSSRLVYAALVAEVVPIAQYGADSRFESKIPRISGEEWERHGDNIYTVAVDGSWMQRRNIHHDRRYMRVDLSGENVMLCPEFWYFGSAAPPVPEVLCTLVKVGPGCKRSDDPALIEALVTWLQGHPRGIVDSPFGPPKRGKPTDSVQPLGSTKSPSCCAEPTGAIPVGCNDRSCGREDQR
jgi:Nucleotide modification associated domain 2